MTPSPRFSAVTLVLLGAVAAHATTMVAYDVARLATDSTVVVRAKVLNVSARWTRDRARIVTDVDLEVTQTWKGQAPERIVVMQPGGVVDDVGQHVAGAARFEVQEDVVLFLEPRGHRFTVVGMEQGKFRVEPSSDGKVLMARQSGTEAHLVDPRNHQDTSSPVGTLTLAELRRAVTATLTPAAPQLPAPTPAPSPATPVVAPNRGAE